MPRFRTSLKNIKNLSEDGFHKENHSFHPRYRWLTIGALVLVLVMLVPTQALAFLPVPAVSGGTGLGGAVDTALNALLGILAYIMQWLKGLLLPVLLMIGALLQNDLLYGGGMEAKLLDIWVQIRNLVNVFFVLVLVGMAFWSVVSGGSERGNFQLKTMLPKLIVALIAVNFSFIGIKVVLDAVNIVTTGIFALPTMTSTSLGMEGDNGKAFCQMLYGNFDTEPQKYKNNIAMASQGKNRAWCKADQPVINMDIPEAATYFSQYNSRNAALVLAINVQKINLLDQVTVTVPTVKDLSINFLFSIVLYVVYGSAFVAMAAVLLVRLAVLWLMIVLSPLIALKSVLPEKLQQQMSGGENIGEQFLKHAIVPIPLALVLTVGFILLDTFSKARFSDATLGFTTLNINVLVAGIPTLQQLIGALVSVAFIWKGVFDAAKDTYAAEFTNGIRGAVEGAGKFLVKLPTAAPIIPTGTGMASLGALRMKMHEIGQLPDELNRENMKSSFPGSKGSGVEGAVKHIESAKTVKDFVQPLGKLRELELEKNTELQKKLASYIKAHPYEEMSLPMDRKQFVEFLEQGGKITAKQMEQFITGNGGKIDRDAAAAGTKKPAPTTPPKPGAPAVPSPEAQAAAKKMAADSGVNEKQLDALKYLNGLKADQSTVDPNTVDTLKKLQNWLLNPKQNEKNIQTALNDPKIKDALQKMAAKMEAPPVDALLNSSTEYKSVSTPENFNLVETALQEQFKVYSKGRPYDSTKTDTNTKDQDAAIFEVMKTKVGNLFDSGLIEKMKGHQGYTPGTVAANVYGLPPTKPKPGSGPAPTPKKP